MIAPPTDKQIGFARKLIEERDVDWNLWSEAMRSLGRWNKRELSREIDELLATKPAREVQVVAETPEGVHYFGDRVYKVQRSEFGRLYAKVLEVEVDGDLTSRASWQYVGGDPLRNLTDDTLLSFEDAVRFGQLYGACAVCGRLLTDEDSIQRGIGPVCAKRYQ